MAVRTSNLWRWATMSAATLLVLSACGDPPRQSALWVVPGWECTWGVFAGECPELGGTMGHDAWS